MADDGAPLRFHNSLTREVEEFHPRVPGSVRLYSCGPTVYNYVHIGNLRAYVFSDTLHRALTWKGYEVRKVVNITDVGHLVADADEGEDKLEDTARRSASSVWDIARHFEAAFLADCELLRIRPADEYPRATDYVPQMVDFAQVLETTGVAYRLPTGLYLDTSKVRDYGRLASMRPQDQREGARVESVEGKRNKTDFALWRTEQPGERRLMRWPSPWGWGAPGWHLECSVMSIELLGPHFDLHTGGVDHRELHHVNEIAQSEAYLDDGQDWVHFWLHNEFMNIGRAKMSKSAGTGVRLAELMEGGAEPAAFRLLLLTAHYRSQTEFSPAALESAGVTLRRLRRRAEPFLPLPDIPTYKAAVAAVRSDAGRAVLDRMDAAIADDLNTPRLVAAVQEALRSGALPAGDEAVVLAAADTLLGLGLGEPEVASVEPEFEDEIRALVERRQEARDRRDWSQADELRSELEQRGVRVIDTATGPRWEILR